MVSFEKMQLQLLLSCFFPVISFSSPSIRQNIVEYQLSIFFYVLICIKMSLVSHFSFGAQKDWRVHLIFHLNRKQARKPRIYASSKLWPTDILTRAKCLGGLGGCLWGFLGCFIRIRISCHVTAGFSDRQPSWGIPFTQGGSWGF